MTYARKTCICFYHGLNYLLTIFYIKICIVFRKSARPSGQVKTNPYAAGGYFGQYKMMPKNL